jgi:HEAT repeat protein
MWGCSDTIRSTFRILVILVGVLIGVQAHTRDEGVAQKVEAILAQASIHSPMGPVKALASLGKPAVPILLEKLPGYRHPTIIISALGRIKDPDSISSLLHYLQSLNLKSKEDTTTTRAVMEAFADIGDRRAEPELLRILRDQEIDIGIRLYSATALLRLASDPGKSEAQHFILNSPDIQRNLSKISPVDLDSAYFEIGTEEAINKLFQAIKSGLPYEQLFIIDLFANPTNPAIIKGLLLTAEDAHYFPDVRFRALEILVKHSEGFKERIQKALIDLRKDAPQESNDKSLVNQEHIDALIQRLKEVSN